MSQSDLAKKAGITFQQIQKYEHGTNRISASRLIELCQALSVSVNDILQGLQKGSSKQRSALDYSFDANKAAEMVESLSPSRRRAALKLLKSVVETE